LIAEDIVDRFARVKRQMPFRLPAELMNRVDKAAAYCGQTRQSFVQSAVLAELAEVEEQKRMKRIRASRASSTLYEPPPREEEDHSAQSVGIGIADSLRKRREVREAIETPPPTTAPIVVNVGNNAAGSSAPSGDIDRLVTYVVNGNDFDRETRLRTAVGILHSSASTDEERKVLAARLDEAIAAKSKTPPAESGGSGVIRAARMTYDKLADFWEGK
jgi:predicted DNA-binding protein